MMMMMMAALIVADSLPILVFDIHTMCVRMLEYTAI